MTTPSGWKCLRRQADGVSRSYGESQAGDRLPGPLPRKRRCRGEAPNLLKLYLRDVLRDLGAMRILQIISLNFYLVDVTQVPEMRKALRLLWPKGFCRQKSRGDWTPLELLPPGLERGMQDCGDPARQQAAGRSRETGGRKLKGKIGCECPELKSMESLLRCFPGSSYHFFGTPNRTLNFNPLASNGFSASNA
jgi:hypothetical protein